MAKPPPMGHASNQKLPRRSSKPIINWLQRKLVGSVRARRLDASDSSDLAVSELGAIPPTPDKPRARISSAPSPSPTAAGHNGTVRNTISLADEDDMPRASPLNHADDASSYHYSDNASFRSGQEADDDASMRPLPPSSPPSPSPSRSSSSYMSDPRTFRSLAASTKPTTLLSIDMHGGGGGMAHIAQAPAPTPVHLARLQTHGRNVSTQTNPGVHSSGASITFSTLPPDVIESRPSSLLAPSAAVQAPLHTSHHPRNNPRPSSPPMDNASVLTLASSAFGIPGAPTRVESSLRSAPLSARGPADSLSYFGAASLIDGDTASQYVAGFDERLDERDMDASVRALRPRSSRRGSWESEMSRWSARGPLGTPSVARDPSLWTKTEELGADVDDAESVKSASATHQDGVSVAGGKEEVTAQATTPLLGHLSLTTEEKAVGEIGKEQAQGASAHSSDSSSAVTPPAVQQQEEPTLFIPAEKARQSFATETGVEESSVVAKSGESRSEHHPDTTSGAAPRPDMGSVPSALSAAPSPAQES